MNEINKENLSPALVDIESDSHKASGRAKKKSVAKRKRQVSDSESKPINLQMKTSRIVII